MKRTESTTGRVLCSCITTSALSLIIATLLCGTARAAGVNGAIFTTTANGGAVNANIYSSKCDVYLDGGPGPHAPATAAGLPDGDYYFQVTDPSGAQLLSTDPVSSRSFHVSGGVITSFTGTGHATGVDQDHAAQGAITIQLANSTCPADFLNTPNGGNVYKVWATPVASFIGNASNVDNPCGTGCFHGFLPSQSKTDNFKAQPGPAATFCLTIQKQFSDGTNVYTDLLGWGMTVTDQSGVSNHYTTDSTFGQVMVCQLEPGSYTVTEDSSAPLPASYFSTVPTILLNNVVESTGSRTVAFTWDPTQPNSMTVLFVNFLIGLF